MSFGPQDSRALAGAANASPAPFPTGLTASWWMDECDGERIHGIGLGELLGVPEAEAPATLSDLVAHTCPDDVELLLGLCEEPAMRPTWSHALRMLRGDGETIWVLSAGRLEQSGDGTCRLWGTFTDITVARQKALAAELALRTAGVSWWSWTPERGRMAWADETGPVVGMPRGWAPADLDEFLALVHPDDRSLVCTEVALVEAGADTYTVEHRIVRPDGAVRWIASSATVERDGDGTTHWVGVHRDITAHHEQLAAISASETHFRLLAEETRDVVSRHDLQGRFTYVNPAARTALGWEPSALLGRSVFELLHPEDALRGRTEIQQRLESGETTLPVLTFRVRGQDGVYRLVEASVVPVVDGAGAVTGTVVVGREISERVAREVEAREREKAKALADLVAGVAHHFNSRLSAIRIHADLIALGQDDGTPQRAWLDRITTAADEAGELSRQLLTFTRQGVRSATVIAVDDFVRAVTPALRARAQLTNHHVGLTLGAPGILVRADEKELAVALIELVENACEAMAAGGTIDLATAPAPGGLSIVVRDHGPGLAHGVRDRLFEPFFSTREYGRGLGLAVARGIVEAAHGTLRIESVPGEGVTCRLWLPSVTSEVPPAVPEPGEADASLEAPYRVAVLVVDDESTVRDAASRYLENAGYEALTAPTGREALALLESRQGRVDVVACDFLMPGMRGDELLREIHARWPRTRALVISGFIDDEAVRDLLLERGTAFLQKPFPMAKLVTLIESVLAA